jgi:hypothetical protein
MSSIIIFFIAPDDDAAAAAIDHVPGQGSDDVVDGYGNFDPNITMEEWESSFGIVGDHDTRVIAGAGPLVVAVSASLQAALVAADEQQLEEVATRWAELRSDTGEDMDQELADEMLRDVAGLARTATRRSHKLYYWWG